MTPLNLMGIHLGKIDVLHKEKRRSKSGDIYWRCKCECGKEFSAPASKILSKTRSCGCVRTHGMCGTPAYISWECMIQRCTNPNHIRWMDYGGRGIIVYPDWMSFDSFFSYMKERPHGTTLDRFPDPNGNYWPGNVRWATIIQQNNNRRKRRKRILDEFFI